MAVVCFSVLFNTVGAKHLPLFESVILFLHIFGFFAILIPLWVLAPKAPAKEVFTSFSNYGGWSSVGAACIVGQLTATGMSVNKCQGSRHRDKAILITSRFSGRQRFPCAFGRRSPQGIHCGPSHDDNHHMLEWRPRLRYGRHILLLHH